MKDHEEAKETARASPAPLLLLASFPALQDARQQCVCVLCVCLSVSMLRHPVCYIFVNLVFVFSLTFINLFTSFYFTVNGSATSVKFACLILHYFLHATRPGSPRGSSPPPSLPEARGSCRWQHHRGRVPCLENIGHKRNPFFLSSVYEVARLYLRLSVAWYSRCRKAS